MGEYQDHFRRLQKGMTMKAAANCIIEEERDWLKRNLPVGELREDIAHKVIKRSVPSYKDAFTSVVTSLISVARRPLAYEILKGHTNVSEVHSFVDTTTQLGMREYLRAEEESA